MAEADRPSETRKSVAPGRMLLLVDDDGRLACDAPCVECGYNLRGLAPDGRCPECGAPASRSLADETLEYASLNWLRRVHRGVAVLAFCMPATLLVAAGMLLAPFGPGVRYPVYTGWGLFTRLTLLALGAVDLYALLLITAREPERFGFRARSAARRVTRILTVLAAITCALGIASSTIGPVWWPVAAYLPAALTGLALLTLLALTRYLKVVFLRTADYRITTSVGSVADAACATLLLVALLWLLQLLLGARIGWLVGDSMRNLPDCAALLSLMGLIGTCFLLFQVKRILGDLIRLGESTGSAPAGGDDR